MFVVGQGRVDGSIQLHWMKTVDLDPKNGGWVQGLTIAGGSIGFSVDQCKFATLVPNTNDVSDPH